MCGRYRRTLGTLAALTIKLRWIMSERTEPRFSRQMLMKELGKIAREAPQPKDQIYKYLKLIYALRFELGAPMPNNIDLIMKARWETLHVNTKTNYIRMIIEQTCNEDLAIGLRSRYANALMYWYERGTKPSKVIECLSREGGIKTWDIKYRAELKKR
jgi:hypothetical protein